MAVAAETPVQGARRRAAVTAIDELTQAEEWVEKARKDRARAIALWKQSGASYQAIANATGLGRSTIIDIVKWGSVLAGDDDALHPRTDRT